MCLEREQGMPGIETIKASEAPAPLKKMSKAPRSIFNAISRLKKDEVLRLQPDPDKSMRGLKTSVSRAASGNDLKIETWTDPEENFSASSRPIGAISAQDSDRCSGFVEAFTYVSLVPHGGRREPR
jgi:hypothetical protein